MSKALKVRIDNCAQCTYRIIKPTKDVCWLSGEEIPYAKAYSGVLESCTLDEFSDTALLNQTIDMTGERCEVCKKGTYKEGRLEDDWDGKVTCDHCGNRIKRWLDEEEYRKN